MMGPIVAIIVVGLIAGIAPWLFARAVVPGWRNFSIGVTLVMGVMGSTVGGFLRYA